jgi:hypothetical protein
MPEITCDGFTFDSDTADVFCFYGGKRLRFQRVILLVGSALIGLAFYNLLHWWTILVSAALVIYVFIRTNEDMQKGFYTAVIKDRMCIRTGHGEATVLISEIRELVFHINSSQLVLKDGRRIDLEPLTKNQEPAYRWMYINLKTPFKNPPRA